jgi:membrane-bound metal-dependent hydrolase YbcI (DUF457 family)
MPDLLTHIMAGYMVSDIRGYDKALFLLGSVLPDAKITYRLFEPFMSDQMSYSFFYVFDTPIVFLPLALMLSVFFNDRIEAFKCFSLAVLLHLALDSLQYKFGGGVPLLYPLSFQRFSLGLFWQDQYYLVVLAFLILISLVGIRKIRDGSDGPRRGI